MDTSKIIQEMREYGIELSNFTLAEQTTIAKQETFLLSYIQSGNITGSAKTAGVSYGTVERWRNDDLYSFNERFQKSSWAFREELQNIAISRLRNPQGSRGSDSLLISMLAAHWPEKYKQATSAMEDIAKANLAELRKLMRGDKANTPNEASKDVQDSVAAEVDEILNQRLKRPSADTP